MPLQAKANGLQLCKVPPELSDLNALELWLICRRVPFMKMVAFTIITVPRVCTSVPFICNDQPACAQKFDLLASFLMRSSNRSYILVANTPGMH